MKEKHFDVIVIGSGAGGAPVAQRLSAAGKKVLIIETGPFVKKDHLGSFCGAIVFGRYYHRLAAFSMSREGATGYHTKNWGGTTVFSCGNMVRALQDVFSSHGIDLKPYFQEAEREMGVRSLPEKRIVTGTKEIAKAANRLGYNMAPMPKGLKECAACNLCGYCFFGCSTGIKTDARLYLERAIENGAQAMVNTKVKKILIDNGHVRGVKISGGEEIECGLVVLAAGGLNTPVILLNSNVDAGNKLFGDFFNVTYGITGDLSQLEGPSMGAVCMDFHKSEGFVISPYIDPLSQAVIACPQPGWILSHLTSWKSRKIGIMTKITDERVGRVFRNGSFSKFPTEQDFYRLNAGAEKSKEILLETKVVKPGSVITTKHPRFAHPGGGAAIGEVVDKTLEVSGVKGLFISDSSTLPETPGLPPILTIVAQSLWLADKLLSL